MKNTINIINIIIAGILIAVSTSCEKELIDNPDQYSRIYMPQAIEKPAERSFVMADTLQTIYFGAAYGGVDDQPNDINVSFKVSAALLDSFNIKNETDYSLMPEGSYSIEKNEAFIPSGNFNSEALKIKVKTVGGLEPLKDYLLPVTIEQVTPQVEINKELQTTYFLVRSEYEYFDRSEWSIVDVSSQEPPNIDSNVLDGNNTTSWHTAWKGGAPPHPHWIIIDMNQVNALHGFYFWPHNTARTGNPVDINIEISMDGASWESLGNFNIGSDFKEQTVYLDQTVQARYFKVIVNASSNNTAFTHPTEIGAF